MVLSLEAEANIRPSGLKETQRTASVCPLKVENSFRCAISRSRTTLSPKAAASILPLGLKTTLLTGAVYSMNTGVPFLLSVSHIHTLLFFDPEASRFSVGLNDILVISLFLDLKILSFFWIFYIPKTDRLIFRT